MAVKNIDNYTSGDGFGMPLNIRRGNPNPLDNSEIWASLTEAENYAKTDPTAYVGQIISYFYIDENEEEQVKAVQIADAAGTLQAIGATSEGIFDDSRFAEVKNKVDLLTSTDETKQGSLAYAEDQAKVTIKLDETIVDGSTNYDIYQGYTYKEQQKLDEFGNPVFDDEGNPVMETVKIPNKIGSIGINADAVIKSGTVVSITGKVDENGNPVQATDKDGNLVFDESGNPVQAKVDSDGDDAPYGLTEGTYLKLKISDGNSVYIETSALGKGMVSEIKTATNTYLPDSSGLIDMSTTLTTDDLEPGTIDTWVFLGGDALS